MPTFADLRPAARLAVLAFVLTVQTAWGGTYGIYVARRDTPAAATAQAKQNGQSSFAETTFHRALGKAAELLNQDGAQTVIVMVAQGEFVGQARTGVWEVPSVRNAEGRLILLGGFNDEFTGRHPFGYPTFLKTQSGRPGPILGFERKSPQQPSLLKELVISGFVMDAAPSNSYDSKSNSILKGSSRTYPLMSFNYLQCGHLVVDSNVFMNGAHGAFDPFIFPMSPDRTVIARPVIDITNNFFLNTIKTMKLEAGEYGGSTAEVINLRNNSFILCWPYNPDPTSSNVSAVELYKASGAAKVVIERNLFAYNPGGALQHDWTEDVMGELVIRENLFFRNAGLFGRAEDDTGVIIGKFGPNPEYIILDEATIQDDFRYTVEKNVVMDPKIPIAIAALQSANSHDVEASATTLNDIRALFGLNQDGGVVKIANYAPALAWFSKAPPLPTVAEARAYGVQYNTFWTFQK